MISFPAFTFFAHFTGITWSVWYLLVNVAYSQKKKKTERGSHMWNVLNIVDIIKADAVGFATCTVNNLATVAIELVNEESVWRGILALRERASRGS